VYGAGYSWAAQLLQPDPEGESAAALTNNERRAAPGRKRLAQQQGRLKPIEEGRLGCLQPSACLVEIEPFDPVDLGECLDGV
jgi:hypothetical protein